VFRTELALIETAIVKARRQVEAAKLRELQGKPERAEPSLAAIDVRPSQENKAANLKQLLCLLKAKVCNLPLLSFPSTGTTVTRRLSSNNS
jgi:hypothetical protein